MAGPITRPSGDRIAYMPTTPSVQIRPNDLLYRDANGAVLPASSLADAGTPAGNRVAFASDFFGVSNGQKRVEDAGTGEIPVIVGSDVQFRLSAPEDFQVGDFLAATEDATGTALENQLVEKTAVANEAIAIVTENKTGTTAIFAVPVSQLTGVSAS